MKNVSLEILGFVVWLDRLMGLVCVMDFGLIYRDLIVVFFSYLIKLSLLVFVMLVIKYLWMFFLLFEVMLIY